MTVTETWKQMDLKVVKDWLEGTNEKNNTKKQNLATLIKAWEEEASRCKFFDALTVKGIQVDVIEHGRVVCTMKIPPRLTHGNILQSGAVASLVDLVGSAVFFTTGSATSGVSIDINISYLDAAYVHDEIELEGKMLRMGKSVGVSVVELKEKKTGKLIAQGRHAKYLAVSSKMPGYTDREEDRINHNLQPVIAPLYSTLLVPSFYR